MGGARLHKRSAEGGKETGGGRVAPILDGLGAAPPKTGLGEKHFFSHRRCPLEAKGRCASGRKGQSVQNGPQQCAAREHAAAFRRGAMLTARVKKQKKRGRPQAAPQFAIELFLVKA